jgi:hypothetical protein
MFRANFCPFSGAQDLDFLQHMVQYPVIWYAGVSELVVWHYVYVVPNNKLGNPCIPDSSLLACGTVSTGKRRLSAG